MAHNIHFNEQTGQHSFFSVKQKAWHGLGQIVSDYPTSAEAIKFAGLDYEVIKSPLYCSNEAMRISKDGNIMENQNIPVPDYFATLRTDSNEVLGVVGRDYEIVQNTEAFAFFDTLLENSNDIRYETAGALGNGERIFITAKLPDYIRVGNEDVIEKYIFLTTSHDGSGSITAAFTPIRIVCNNTLNAALKNMTRVVRIKHTSNAKQRLEQAHKVLLIAGNASSQLEHTFNHWANVRITDKEIKRLIELALASKETVAYIKEGKEDKIPTAFKNRCADAFTYAMLNDTQHLETTKGTVFGAFNAVTGYYQNVLEYKNDEAKVKSIIYGGTAYASTEKAFELCDSFSRYGAEALFLN